MNERRYFGTDGVRGRMGEEPITPEFVLKLGWAAGMVLGQGHARPKVLIGKDTRVSGYLLESALEAGLSAAGVDIALLGPMPTPGIAYLTRTARARAGIVISASHNPYDDNGIKFFSPQGTKLEDAIEFEIEHMLDQPLVTVPSDRLGKAERFSDAAGRYIEFCKSAVSHRLDLRGLKIVVDCANGAAYHIAPSVFAELGAEVIALGVKPDGFNINRDCGSTHLDAVRSAVVENAANLGIALDGDGDRAILVDEYGSDVDGDQILFILATSRQKLDMLEGGVVGTLMSNLGLEQALAEHRIPFRRAQVGDRYVMGLLQEEGWLLGGESSGHVICLDKSTTGDGIIAALQVLQAMADRGRTLAELHQGLTIYPQTMVNVKLPRNVDPRTLTTDQNSAIRNAVLHAEGQLSDRGRILLRPSGTEPVIRVMVEGEDAEAVERISTELAAAVAAAAAGGTEPSLATA